MSVRQHNTSAYNNEILQVNEFCVNSAELAHICAWDSVYQQFWVQHSFVSLFCGCINFDVGSLLCMSECERNNDVCVL